LVKDPDVVAMLNRAGSGILAAHLENAQIFQTAQDWQIGEAGIQKIVSLSRQEFQRIRASRWFPMLIAAIRSMLAIRRRSIP
jgi:hypothetical protein